EHSKSSEHFVAGGRDAAEQIRLSVDPDDRATMSCPIAEARRFRPDALSKPMPPPPKAARLAHAPHAVDAEVSVDEVDYLRPDISAAVAHGLPAHFPFTPRGFTVSGRQTKVVFSALASGSTIRLARRPFRCRRPTWTFYTE